MDLDELCGRNDIGKLLQDALEKQEQNIKAQTRKAFGSIISAIYQSLGTLIAVQACCAGDDKYPSPDPSGGNEHDAQVIKLIRHSASGYHLARLIADLTLKGHYSPAQAMLRILVEDATKAAFYASYPEEAAKHLRSSGRQGAEVPIEEMREKLGWDAKALGKLDGFLSHFAHAHPTGNFTNLLLPDFDQEKSYTLLVNIANHLKILLHALGKVFPPDQDGSCAALAEEWDNSLRILQEVEDNIDASIYRLSVVTKWSGHPTPE